MQRARRTEFRSWFFTKSLDCGHNSNGNNCVLLWRKNICACMVYKLRNASVLVMLKKQTPWCRANCTSLTCSIWTSYDNALSSEIRKLDRTSPDFNLTTLVAFHPRPVLAFGYCRCLGLSVSPSVRPSVTKFVRAITNYPFKLGSPNLDQRCKRPRFRSLLFCGTIDCDRQGQIELQSQNLPHFELVHAITHHQLKLQFPNLGQKCILALFRSLPILGLIEIDLQFNF